MIAVIDYGMGNLLSVKNAVEASGATARVVTRGAELADASAVILPGVGAFGKGMAGLRERGFVDALERDVREKKKPFLGICLGLQLLASKGMELGEHEGLGWIPGTVERLTPPAPNFRVPHIGWNEVRATNAAGGAATGGVPRKSRLLEGVPAGSSFYFLHSFHLVPADPTAAAAVTDHGIDFVSICEVETVFAVQFHPEKSHKHGLRVLRNFLTFAGHA